MVDEPVEVWEVPKGEEKTEEEIHGQDIEGDEYLESGMRKRVNHGARRRQEGSLSWESRKVMFS